MPLHTPKYPLNELSPCIRFIRIVRGFMSNDPILSWMKQIPSGRFSSPLQLRHHRGGVPVAPHGVDFSVLIDLEYIDAFYENIASVVASSAAREFDRRAVARDEDMIRRQLNGLEQGKHAADELTQRRMPL